MLFASLALALGLIHAAFSAERPNIVMIIADDMGFNDVGHHGGEIPTPNIDALGYHGVLFNRHYSQPTCTPSRAALMTARYPIRMGMQGKPISAGQPVGLPLSETIFPEYLAQLGYKNHIVGKWHLGSCRSEFLPTNRGFDSHFGFWNGYIGHYDGIHANGLTDLKGMDIHRGTEDAWGEAYGKHITSVLTDEGVKVIREHKGDGGLFLLMSHSAPHTGNLGMELISPPTTLDPERRNNITDPKRKIYADMVKALDDSVGKIVEALAQEGKLDNSIIVFLSDNGAPTTDDLWGFQNHGSNWPLRGEKCSGHEGGVRTAAVMWSPLLENPGRVYNNMFHISDWLPTLLTAAGGRLDVKRLDGIDQWKRLVTGEGGAPPRKLLLADMEPWGSEALINGKWKLVKGNPEGHEMAFADNYHGASGRGLGEYNVREVENSIAGKLTGGRSKRSYLDLRKDADVAVHCMRRIAGAAPPACRRDHCLFDMITDPCESSDLSRFFPHVVKEMKSILLQYRQSMVSGPKVGLDPLGHPKLWGNRWVPWLDMPSSSSKVSTSFPLFACLSTIYILLRRFG